MDLIKNIKCQVILITKEKTRITKLDIEKYESQYNNLKIIYNNDFHDRYFILDRKIVYHCGTSLNNAGSKTFFINVLEDKFVTNSLINKIALIVR